MTRYVSLGVLLAVIAVLSILFYKILAGFFVPLFLASLLVVIFRPLHRWVLDRCRGHQKLAALLTTLSVLFVVLLPMGIVLTLAVFEAKDAVADFNAEELKSDVRHIRSSVGLDLPIANEIREIDSAFDEMQKHTTFEDLEYHSEWWTRIQLESEAIEKAYPWLVQKEPGDALEIDPDKDSKLEWKSFIDKRDATISQWDDTKQMLEPTEERTDEEGNTISVNRSEELSEYHQLLNETAADFTTAKNTILGGRALANLKLLVNPDDEHLEEYSYSLADMLQGKILTFGGATTAFIAKLLVGCAIMVISLYFFLLDGPAMIESFQGLSPLDDDHEKELVDEFAIVSRAVVVATLLSALAQGLLASIGFYFCGFESIFLLTMLTTAMALVPFVGAASVWVPACLYLYFFQNDIGAAIGLAVYGVAVISMADNVIKPLVLHGQSNLHPLLALLSVLGGVTALGPIGLLVGPMVVVFLQTLLKIFQREISEMETDSNAGAGSA